MRPLTSVATSGCSPLLPTQALQAFQACTTTTLSLVVPAILLPAATPPSRRTTITRVDEHDDDEDDDDDDVASNSVSAVDGGAADLEYCLQVRQLDNNTPMVYRCF